MKKYNTIITLFSIGMIYPTIYLNMVGRISLDTSWIGCSIWLISAFYFAKNVFK